MAHRGCVNDGQLRAGHTVHRRGTVWCLDLQCKISSRIPFHWFSCAVSTGGVPHLFTTAGSRGAPGRAGLLGVIDSYSYHPVALVLVSGYAVPVIPALHRCARASANSQCWVESCLCAGGIGDA
jgi:hypothetical protein